MPWSEGKTSGTSNLQIYCALTCRMRALAAVLLSCLWCCKVFPTWLAQSWFFYAKCDFQVRLTNLVEENMPRWFGQRTYRFAGSALWPCTYSSDSITRINFSYHCEGAEIGSKLRSAGQIFINILIFNFGLGHQRRKWPNRFVVSDTASEWNKRCLQAFKSEL